MMRKFIKFESSSRLNAMKFSFDIDLPKSNDIISLFLNISNIAGTINENKIKLALDSPEILKIYNEEKIKLFHIKYSIR